MGWALYRLPDGRPGGYAVSPASQTTDRHELTTRRAERSSSLAEPNHIRVTCTRRR